MDADWIRGVSCLIGVSVDTDDSLLPWPLVFGGEFTQSEVRGGVSDFVGRKLVFVRGAPSPGCSLDPERRST